MPKIGIEQLTLGDAVAVLKRKDPDAWVYFDFVHFRPNGKVHSYRGYYEDLAIGYDSDTDMKVGQLLAALESAVGQTFTGWKGGEYTMDHSTALWVANPREAGGTAVIDIEDDGSGILLVTEKVD